VVLTWVSVPGCLGLGTGRTHWTRRGASGPLPREVYSLTEHRTHAADPLGCVWSHTQRGLKFALAPDTIQVSHRIHCGCVWCVAEQVQLAIDGAPDALRSAFGAPVFGGIRVVGPWTSWGVFILLHLVHGRSLAHLIS